MSTAAAPSLWTARCRNEHSNRGFAYKGITAAAAERDVPVPLAADYAGPATIAGYTVVFTRNEPSHAIAVCDTPAAERTVMRSDDPALAERMTREEFVGRHITVQRDGGFCTPQ